MSYINPVNKPHCLQLLCENSYDRLLTLFPSLKKPSIQIQTPLINKGAYLQVFEISPYTLSFTVQSVDSQNNPIKPTITCRFYLDSKSVEVIHVDGFIPSLSQFKKDKPKVVLDKKWVLNYFLDQWLDFKLHPQSQVAVPANLLSA